MRLGIFLVWFGAVVAPADGHAGLARDRLAQAGAEQFAARAMETSRVRFHCAATDRADEVFAILGRPYDIGLALRIASREVWALQCWPALKPVRQDGQRYRPRLVLVDPVGHRVLYAWSYTAVEGLNRLASDQLPSNP